METAAPAAGWLEEREPDPEQLVAALIDAPEEMVLTGPGAAPIIERIFHHFAPAAGDVVISRPSFILYEFLAQVAGIRPEYWPLNEEYQYDLMRFPAIRANSFVLIASLTPTSTFIPERTLATLLEAYPESLFVLDDDGNETSTTAYQSLLYRFQNLMIVRAVSGTYANAGLPSGYVLAHPHWLRALKESAGPAGLFGPTAEVELEEDEPQFC